LRIVFAVKEIYSNTDIAHFKTIKYEQYKKKLELLESEYSKYVTDAETEESINKQFNASKTAINGLNFVTKDSEKILAQSESPELDNLFRLIYIIIKEDIPEINIIANMVNNTVGKYGEKSLSNIF
jgi:hypothetical protein